jgi:hypothetical protein
MDRVTATWRRGGECCEIIKTWASGTGYSGLRHFKTLFTEHSHRSCSGRQGLLVCVRVDGQKFEAANLDRPPFGVHELPDCFLAETWPSGMVNAAQRGALLCRKPCHRVEKPSANDFLYAFEAGRSDFIMW